MADLLRAVRGMNDIVPAAMPQWQAFEAVVQDWLRAYGYAMMRTPIVEPTPLFVRAIGEVTDIVEKEMYSFTDGLNGDSLTLRPEGTAACLRAVLEHQLLQAGPQRLAYMGPMFRHERPQKGRYRQFHQVGIEALGFAGPDVDAELLLMSADLWRRLGLTGLTLELNTLGSAEDRARYRSALTAYLVSREAELDEDSQRRLHRNPLRVLDSKNPAMQAVIAGAPQLLEALSDESRQHFEQLQAMLNHAGLAYRINPRLVRGLDYYNLTVFEWTTTELGAQATVCAGGRYDGLIAQLGGKPTPACGFGMGIERLLLLQEAQGQKVQAAAPHVYLVHQAEHSAGPALALAQRLRGAGWNVVMHCGGGSFKAQFRKADGSGATVALVLGEDELREQQVVVKTLRQETEQQRVPLAGLEAVLQQLCPVA